MKPIQFPEQNAVIAKDQSEYITLPAHIDKYSGIVTCCWQLTFRERLTLLFSGKLWHHIRTFNQPLQPQKLGTYKPSFYGNKIAEPTA